MHLEDFAVGRTALHRADPRGKWAVFVLWAVFIALQSRMTVAWLAFGFAVILAVAARPSLEALLKRVAAVNAFVLLLWLTAVWGADTGEGLRLVLLITLKVNAVFLLTVAILGTTELFALAHALAHFRVPRKLLFLFFFMYRYLSVLHAESDKLRNAMRARAFVARFDLRTWRVTGWWIGMLFVRSYERSQRVYRALVLRGFREDFPLVRHFGWRRADTVLVTVMIMALGGLFLCR
ncbi:MAG: cobalt ECF transporter T component CbiQ [Candidatus Omnitrophica bacterium]|nr:cobalt ECF transporter T component CbiQ [Candidatus Omnitrophota bacterium]